MGNLLLISGLAAVVLVGLWYLCLARYNRRKGREALHWVEIACASRGRIVDARWIGASRLQAHLRFVAHWFENASVTVRLLPRPLPVQWLLSRWHKERETVTFEADLDYAPGVHFEVLRQRWLTHNSKQKSSGSRDWTIVRPLPVVLTTTSPRRQDLPPVLNTLMSARGHNLLSVRLRPQSPHLEATIDLEALSDQQMASGFLFILRDLAMGASASRQ